MENEIPRPDLLHVLSLEDSDIDFELIIEQLINTGLQIDLSRAVTEIEFTSFIRNNNYDIILADYNLPQFDAFGALKLCQEFCHITKKFSTSFQQKNINISLPETPENSKYMLFTDEVLLGKIFHQLIDNALKFSSNGTIFIGCEKQKDEHHFFVKDTGIGISEEYKSRIFGNFEQEDFANTRKYEGTGIGLSIVKGLVELLGGKIGLESEKGKGSTFYFSIPIE